MWSKLRRSPAAAGAGATAATATPAAPRWGGLLGRRDERRAAADEDAESHRLTFREVDRVLAIYTTALTDGKLTVRGVEGARGAYTDGMTIYLPDSVAEFPTRAENFRLYKAMIAHKWAQTRFGSLEVGDFLHRFEDRALATDLYSAIESARIEALLAGEFRGLARELRHVSQDALAKRPHPKRLPKKSALVEALLQGLLHQLHPREPGADAVVPLDHPVVREGLREGASLLADGWQRESVLELCARLYREVARQGAGSYDRLPIVHYRGDLRPDRVAQRLAEEARKRQSAPRWLPVPDKTRQPLDDHKPMIVEGRFPFDNAEGRPEGRKDPATHTQVQVSMAAPDMKEVGREIGLNEEEKRGAHLYEEWDYRRQSYRDEWCALRERKVRVGSVDYVQGVLAKHHGLVQTIKRQFEALRPESRRLRRQPDGEEIDIDAVVDAFVDRRVGRSPSERLYIARHDTRRDISVAFLIDLSGSTGSWVPEGRVIDIEKEALILMAEALEILGDRYAIFGFSGATRKQCDFYKVKDFGEAWNETVKGRIGSLDTFSYTRMGPPIRHVTRMFERADSKIKLVILLSDGRPNDFDAYGGRYGVEDTRRALLEAREGRVRTFGITIDTEARDYMPYLFGDKHWVMVDQVAQLPTRLPELYRRLTTA